MKPTQIEVSKPPLESIVKQTYDQDFYQWTLEQTEALREQNLDALDWNNLIEEIESLGKEQLRAVESYLKQLIAHQFKIKYVNDPYCLKGWQKEINNFKDEIEDRFTQAMKAKINLEKVYQRAKRDLLIDYPEIEDKLPETCPYSIDDLLKE